MPTLTPTSVSLAPDSRGETPRSAEACSADRWISPRLLGSLLAASTPDPYEALALLSEAKRGRPDLGNVVVQSRVDRAAPLDSAIRQAAGEILRATVEECAAVAVPSERAGYLRGNRSPTAYLAALDAPGIQADRQAAQADLRRHAASTRARDRAADLHDLAVAPRLSASVLASGAGAGAHPFSSRQEARAARENAQAVAESCCTRRPVRPPTDRQVLSQLAAEGSPLVQVRRGVVSAVSSKGGNRRRR